MATTSFSSDSATREVELSGVLTSTTAAPTNDDSASSSFGVGSWGLVCKNLVVKAEDKHCCSCRRRKKLPPIYGGGGVNEVAGESKDDDSGGANAILRDVSGLFAPEKLHAIIGSSGCGKTTLLSALAQNRLSIRHFQKSGIAAPYCEADPREAEIQFVMATDVFIPELTAREYLTFTAEISRRDLSRDARKETVNRMLVSLGMQACADTKIGRVGRWDGLSRGERKRLSIGVGVLTMDRGILLLDEPTTHLDTPTALSIVLLLKNLLASGDVSCIVASFHQPSDMILRVVDTLTVMGCGKICYQGPFANALSSTERILVDAERIPHGTSPISSGIQNSNTAALLLKIVNPTDQENQVYLSEPQEGVWRPSSADDIDIVSETFFRSKGGTALLTEIMQATEGIVSLPIPGFKDKFLYFFSAQFWTALWLLCKRTMTALGRSKTVLFIIPLLLLLEGVLVGSVLYRSGDPDTLADAVDLITEQDFLSDAAQVFFYKAGYEDTSPLFAMLKYGVDGAGSEPLVGVLSDPGAWRYLYQLTMCLYDEFDVDGSFTYPPNVFLPVPWDPRDMNVIPEAPPSPMDDDWKNMSFFTPKFVNTEVVTLLQVLDWLMYKQDMPDLMSCYKDGTFGKVCLIKKGEPIISPLLKCLGFPQLPFFLRGEPRPKIEKSEKQKVFQRAPSASTKRGNRRILEPRRLRQLFFLINYDNRLWTFVRKLCELIGVPGLFDLIHNILSGLIFGMSAAASIFFVCGIFAYGTFDAFMFYYDQRFYRNREIAAGMYKMVESSIVQFFAPLPFRLIGHLLVSTATYFLIGFPADRFGWFLLAGIALSFACYSEALAIAAACPSPRVAYRFYPMVIVVCVIFSGFFLRSADLPSWISWMYWITPFRFGFQAMMLAVFPPNTEVGMVPSEIVYAADGITERSFSFCVGIIFAIGFGHLLLAHFLQCWFYRRIGLF